jgi:hypothetical protein
LRILRRLNEVLSDKVLSLAALRRLEDLDIIEAS